VIAKDMSQNVLLPLIDFSAVDMNTPGTYDVVYIVTDSHDLEAEYTLSIQVLSVENADTVAPVVTIKSGVPTSVDQFTQIQVDLRMLVDAVDAIDGVISVTSDMVDDGGLNFNVAGVYRVTYRVYDLSGNVGILEVDVTVNDKQAPSIGMNDQTINYGSSFDPRAGLVVNDNIDGIIDNAEVTITGLDQFMVGDKAMVAGVFDIVYTVSDAAGNEASKTVKIRVLDVIWDESSETTLGIPDEGPTHSTVEFDPAEQAYVISDIDINVDPWDHARWVYYFNDKDLEFGRTYKIVITAKATTATDLYFWIGTTLTVEPWIDSFSGTDKEKVTISDEYQTYEVIFTVNKENFNTIKSAKFQFMYGYLPTDTDNTIYIKEFNIVSDLQPTYTELEDLLGGHDELQAVTAVLDGGVLTLSDILVGNNPRLVYYFPNSLFTIDGVYRFVITVKADEARDLEFWIGSTLWEEPWLDTFDGGRQIISIGTEYVTYTVEFMMDKSTYFANGAKFQFQFGFVGDQAGNNIYINEFRLEKVEYPYIADFILVDDFGYADEDAFEAEWTQRTNTVDYNPSTYMNLDVDKGAMVFEMPTPVNNGWHIARKYDSLASFGVTDEYKYLAFYMTNNTTRDSAHIWLYYAGTQNSYAITLPAVGETGWAVIDVTVSGHQASAITDFGIGFNNWSSNPYIGDITVYFVCAVQNPDELAYITPVEEEEPKEIYYLVDDFVYEDEDAFEAEWTQRTNSTNVSPSELMNLDSENDAMIFAMPDVANGGWHMARKYDSLASFGVPDEYKYLAFYMTNNTNRTTAAVWLYYAGTQNSYAITLPPVGETGWAYVDVTASGHQVSGITDFGLGFNNWAGDNQYVGSVTVIKIVMVEKPSDLIDVDVPVVVEPPLYHVVDSFEYKDEDEFEAEWTQRTNSVNYNPGPRMNLDAELEAMVFTLADPINNGWDMPRKYSSLTALGVTDEMTHLAFYMTNNTDQTSIKVWFYWSGSQDKYTMTMPAIGETGWAYIAFSVCGKLPSQITDFAFGFDNQSWTPAAGSYTIYEIGATDDPSKLDQVDVYVPVIVEPPLYHVVDSFTYADEDAFEAEWTQRTSGNNYNPGPRMNLDAALEAMVFTLATPINNGWDLARKYTSLTALGVSDEMTHLAFYMTNNTDQTSIKVWFYWSGSQDNYTMTLPAIGETGWATIAFSACGKLPSLITDIAIGFDNQSWSPAAGSYTIYEIGATDDPSKLDMIDVHIPEVTNNAPIVSISQANLAILSGLTLIDGEDITALLGSLLSMISIEDTEDGAIVATIEMVDLKGLNPANPIMGSYQIEIQTKDSDGLDSNVLTIPLSIVGILDDFDEYVDDADFKAEFPLYGFRSGSGWNVASGTLVVGDDNTLQLTYVSGTNGIRFNISKATLLSLGAEYIGIKITTSEVLTGTPKFQAFEYDTSGGYSELYGLQGIISATATGTYVFIPVSALKDTTASISILINVGAGNTGTMTLDNLVIK
jgi:hypothetical protein